MRYTNRRILYFIQQNTLDPLLFFYNSLHRRLLCSEVIVQIHRQTDRYTKAIDFCAQPLKWLAVLIFEPCYKSDEYTQIAVQ